MSVGRLRRGFSAFNRTTSLGAKVFLILLLVFAGAVVFSIGYSAYDDYKFNRLSSAEHLATAKRSLNEPYVSARHLSAITSGAAEYDEATELLAEIRRKQQELAGQAEKLSREQMLRNVQGTAHDSFKCSTSTAHQPIMSFR